MPDLAFEALLENQMDAVFALASPDALDFCVAFLGHHALDQLGKNGGGIDRFVDHHLVFLFNAFAGVHEALRKITTIGHQQQALALLVEPAHMVEILELGRQQIINGEAIMGVAPATHITLGFVQGENDAFSGPHHSAIDPDFVLVTDLGSQAANVGAVDGNLTLGDQSLNATAGTESAQAEKTVEAHDGGKGKRIKLQRKESLSLVRLGLGQVGGKAAFRPQSAGFQQLDALTTFEDAALGADGAGSFEAAVLGHGRWTVKVLEKGLGGYVLEIRVQLVFGEAALALRQGVRVHAGVPG